MNIGKRIKEERRKKEWTQEQLGEKLNVSRSAVSSWEVGRNYPDLETIILISDLFEVSLDQLLREDEDMTKNVTKKIKMNKYYKMSLIFLLFLIFSYIGFNLYLSSTEKKYHKNLEKNGWEIYYPDNEPGFNQFILNEDGIDYYTSILPTGLIGFPLEEQKLTIISKKNGLVMLIKDKKDMEIVISKENDPNVGFNSRVQVNEKLEIINKQSSLSDETEIMTEEYIDIHKKDYEELIDKTLKQISKIKK